MLSRALAAAAFHSAFEQSPLAIAIYDKDLRFVDVNDAFAALDDLPRASHAGRSLAEILPDLADTIAAMLRTVFAAGAPLIDVPMTGVRSRTSQQVRDWAVDYTPMREGDEIVAVAAVVREVTGEVRLKRLLDAQKSILEQLARGDSLGDVLQMIVDTIRSCSVDGFLPSILLLDEATGVLRHGASAGLPQAYDRAIDGSPIGPAAGSCGTAAYRRERVIVSDIETDPLWDGYRDLARPFGLRACWSAPIVAPTGGVLGTFALYHREQRRPSADDLDLVELVARTTALAIELRRGADARQQLLDAERRARRDAEAASRGKDEFVAALSHELRTPLNAILGWVSMLKTGTLREGGESRAIDAIERNTVAQRRLVEDLLDVSRIILGKMTVSRAPIDVGQLVDAAAEAVRHGADGRGVRLEVDRAPGAVAFDGDYDRLKQVVCNLLANAIKFTPAGGSVTLSLRLADERIEIIVRDTGCGIAAELLPHVFERFRQGERPADSTTSGLGLGLAIADHIVRLHGGDIEAASDGAGLGSTFRIVLRPRSPAASAGPG
jgi:PAS domain S-box-containing protein